MNWVTSILGIALLLAPFVFGYTTTPWALWTSLIGGVLIAIYGHKPSYKTASILGLIVFLAPWITGFSGVSGAAWSCWILGGAVAILAGIRGFFSKEAGRTGNVQPHTA